MGYEVCFKYYERLETGDYNKDEAKEFKRKIGDPFEEITLEKLASVIMSQLARRDVWITGVNVFEYKKQEITFRETKGGIVIKNKKFMLDDNNPEFVSVQDIAEPQTQSQYDYVEQDYPHNQAKNLPPQNKPQPSQNHEQPHNVNRPRRKVKTMVFSPELRAIPELKQRGLRLTIDQKYDIYNVKVSANGISENYTIVDDLGREIIVPDTYFIPAEVKLFADNELGFTKSSELNDRLLWGGLQTDEYDVPDLR